MAQIEVNEMFGLMCHIRTKISTNNAVPGRMMLFIEFLFNVTKKTLINSFEGVSKQSKTHAAMSFSILNFSKACVAQSTASCCMSSDMSAFLTTALRSDMVVWLG